MLKYITKPQKRALIIEPHWYIGVFARGTGKTTQIQAMRSMLCAMNMPHGLSCFYNATYVGAQQRTVANTLAGWREYGWIEGRDYVKNIIPPKNFILNKFYQPISWKNTISTKNGHIFVIASNDRPGLVNSLSITGGIFVDECRFIDYELMKNDLFPAIRGKNIWGENNPYVFSRTFTTDMPFLQEDMEWFFDMQKLMDKTQIKLVYQASIKVHKQKSKIASYQNNFNQAKEYNTKLFLLEKISNFKETLKTKIKYANSIRMNFFGARSVYFDHGSFLSNIHILGSRYFFDNVDIKKTETAKVSFLNIKSDTVTNKFYSHLSKKHFIPAEYDYSETTLLSNDNFIYARQLQQYDANKEIDIDFDFGDMCSCSVSQTHGNKELYLASFDVVLPLGISDLITIVDKFLAGHLNKRIYVYKDASGNYMKDKQGQTFGIEAIQEFKRKGWITFDKCPSGSVNPSHSAKWQLLKLLLQEDNPLFPIVRIIQDTNQQLESSLRRAPLIVYKDKQGTTHFQKDKSSEKLIPLVDKPFLTTDHSDHFDYKLWHKYSHLLPQESLF